MEIATLLGVREVLILKDLEFPILFYDGIDDNGVVIKCSAIAVVTHECDLNCG